MRIVFFGTPELAVPSLEALSARHAVVAAVCQPDKPQGRSKQPVPPPVKVRALDLGIPIQQPVKLNDGHFEAWLREQAPELCALVAYGRILKPAIIGVPVRGFINLHPSLLPKYRGPSPIQSALLHGDPETGVTIMRIEEETDAGAVLLQRAHPIGERDNTETLSMTLAGIGADMLLEAISLIETGMAVYTPQDGPRATHCAMVHKDDARIDWRLPAREIHNRVRAFVPWPVAHGVLRGEVLRIFQTSLVEGDTGAAAGTIIGVTKDSIVVATGSGLIAIERLQAPGKKPMFAAEFLRGRPISVGEHFEVTSCP